MTASHRKRKQDEVLVSQKGVVKENVNEGDNEDDEVTEGNIEVIEEVNEEGKDKGTNEGLDSSDSEPTRGESEQGKGSEDDEVTDSDDEVTDSEDDEVTDSDDEEELPPTRPELKEFDYELYNGGDNHVSTHLKKRIVSHTNSIMPFTCC